MTNPVEVAKTIFRAIRERDITTMWSVFRTPDRVAHHKNNEPDPVKMNKFFDRELKFLGDVEEMAGEARSSPNYIADIVVKIRPVKKKMHVVGLVNERGNLRFYGILGIPMKKWESFEVMKPE